MTEPVTDFTTYFGSSAHGLFVNWASAIDQAEPDGTTDITMSFTANLRSKLHVFADTTTTGGADDCANWTDTLDLCIDYSSSGGTAGVAYNADDTQIYTLQYYVAWQNPDASSSITYDGVQGRVVCTVTTGDRSDFATTPPTVSCIWQDRASDINGAASKFDVRPFSLYDSGDGAQDTNGADDITLVTLAATEQCTEVWYLTDSALACVELQGSLKRPRNTGDIQDDIILEYTTYSMHALIGRVDDTSSNADEALRLDAQDVDFSVFVVDSARYGLTVAGGMVAGLLAMTF